MDTGGEGTPPRAAVDARIHAALQRRSDMTRLLAEAGAARVRVPGLAAALDEASVARTPAPDQARVSLVSLTLGPSAPVIFTYERWVSSKAPDYCVSSFQIASLHSSHESNISEDIQQAGFCSVIHDENKTIM